MNIQATYATRTQLGVDGSIIDVSVKANNVCQSENLLSPSAARLRSGKLDQIV